MPGHEHTWTQFLTLSCPHGHTLARLHGDSGGWNIQSINRPDHNSATTRPNAVTLNGKRLAWVCYSCTRAGLRHGYAGSLDAAPALWLLARLKVYGPAHLRSALTRADLDAQARRITPDGDPESDRVRAQFHRLISKQRGLIEQPTPPRTDLIGPRPGTP